jgi:hypothetical protein
MVTAGASLVWLVAIAILASRPRWDRAAWQPAGIYIAAFLLGSAFQWIPSLLATHNPFYNDPGQNVWFHLYGKTDFIKEWQEAPAGITVFQVFAANPYGFIQHWWASFERFWVAPELTLLDTPLRLFAQAGLVFLLLVPRPAGPRVRGLVALFVLAQIASLSLLRLDKRFLLVVIPVLAVGAVYFFASLVPPRWDRPRFWLPLNVLVLLAGLGWALQVPVGFVQGRPAPDWTVLRASNALHAAGMRSPQEVLSTQGRLQDAASLGRIRFPQAYAFTPNLASIDELLQVMSSPGKGWRFFIYDHEVGSPNYPALQSLLAPETHPKGLVPIYYPDDHEFVIYRLKSDQAGCVPSNTRFANGISLECYEVHVAQDAPAGSGRRAGVYLNWRADSQISTSLKVFVHLLAAGGRLVAQDDSGPALWTYPTDTWKPGQVVVDFHQFPVDAQLSPGSYTLQVGLYDEATGTRLSRVDTAGSAVDDKAILTTLQIK